MVSACLVFTFSCITKCMAWHGRVVVLGHLCYFEIVGYSV